MRKLLFISIWLFVLTSVCSAGTTTTNYSLYKPAINETGWGASVNTNMDTIDTQMKANADAVTTHIADTSTHGVSGAIVGTTDTQTLTNKTITGTFTGNVTGNASTATALSANGSNCSSGNSPLGVDASGAVESCFDVWTEAENTAAGYISGNETITIDGDVNGSGTTAITLTINWEDIESFSYSEINWESIPTYTEDYVLTATTGGGINWEPAAAAVNWNEVYAEVNWTIIDETYLDGINWQAYDNDNYSVNWDESYAGINWTLIIETTLDGINWAQYDNDNVPAGNVNWDEISTDVNWSTIAGYSEGNVMTATTNGGANWQAPSGSGYWTDLEPNLEPNDDGDGIQLNDSGGTDYCVIKHDGTDLDVACTNTTQVDINVPMTVGGTDQSTITEGLVVNDAGGGDTDDDFRAETDNDENAILVDASADIFIVDVSLDIGTVETFVDEDATPDVSAGSYWNTNTTATTVTDFDGTGIADGQIIVVISKGAITYDVTSSGLKGGTTDLVTASGDLTMWIYDGTDWYLINFVDQSDDLS